MNKETNNWGLRAGLDAVETWKIPSLCRESNPGRPAPEKFTLLARGNTRQERGLRKSPRKDMQNLR